MQPSLDTWTSIFLLAVAMGVFLFFVLISSTNKKNRPIAFLVLAFSGILLQYVLYWTNYQSIFPYLILFPSFCYYLTGPLLYLYLLNLYKKNIKLTYAVHFLPSALLLIPNLVVWINYLEIASIEIPLLSLVQNYWFIIIHMVVYSIAMYWLILKNNATAQEYTLLRKRWALTLVSLYSIFVLAYISYYVLINFSFFNKEWDYMISITMSIAIYTIGYFAIQQPKVFDGEFYAALFIKNKHKNESFETSLLNEFFDYLTNFMEKEKPYLDNELRLVNLADKVGFSTHLLSKIINEKSGMNFNQFINTYRLKEAESLLLSNSNKNIKSIYFDVGFNNKVTFYKAFKKKHNCTPSEFKIKSSEI